MIKRILPFFMVITICFTGCNSSYPTNNNDTDDFSYQTYTGYLDTLTSWPAHEEFKDQDYDNDGTIDRIYRQYNESDETCTLRFDFGSGDSFTVEGLSDKGRLYVQAVDFDNDAQSEIFISQDSVRTLEKSYDAFLGVYQKQDDTYKQIPLEERFANEQSTTTPSIHLQEEFFKGEGVRIVTRDFESNTRVDHMICLCEDVLERYHEQVGEGREHRQNLCSSEVISTGDKSCLVLSFTLLEDWDVEQAAYTLEFQDGKFVATGVELTVPNAY